jgi:hypothetical protein
LIVCRDYADAATIEILCAKKANCKILGKKAFERRARQMVDALSGLPKENKRAESADSLREWCGTNNKIIQEMLKGRNHEN